MNAYAPQALADPVGLEPPRPTRGRGSSLWGWRLRDQLILLAAWGAGIGLCLIAGAIVLYMGIRGFQYLRPDLLITRPQAGVDQNGAGGFLDPLVGTAVLTLIGISIALPLGVCAAAWIVEYGQGGRARQSLARLVESSIEIVAGTPDIVIAIFGLAVFQLGVLGPLSSRSESGVVTGHSFIAAGATMSLIALPPLFAATREGLQAVPAQVREAAFALGKTRIATIRRVLIPSVRSNIATGATLGISRIVGDTAIVIVVLAEGAPRNEAVGSTPVLGFLRGTGSSLTSFVYGNSPAGEGNSPTKAYAAAFVLLLFILALNGIVGLIARAHARSSGFDVGEARL
ncbi:MAG TPA: ABC transporter permease subunit [Solirubrobacteraceae bacterium]|jgi:phosphate transport system permease protein|nr:ABC transporter permease subunit [Solirubrobacteraceae bacterium]